jgi:hypothetical protein
VPTDNLLAVFTVNFKEVFELVSENTMNPGKASPLAREALLVITIAWLRGLT